MCALSQNFSLTKAQLGKVTDSLRVLPIVRQEANTWRSAYWQCDSASEAKSDAAITLSQAYRAALDAEQQRSMQAAANASVADLWKKKAMARGWKLAALLSLFAGYVFVRK